MSRLTDAMTGQVIGRRFTRWFWRPPRPHGETIPDRTVSFLELFYDLAYVVVVGQAAGHLAEHVSVRGFMEFVVVFALVWIAWVNGSLYLELHAREDGRTRTVVFLQMVVIALLAVFTGDATEASGAAFALVYAALLTVLTWLWCTVRGQDRLDRPEFLAVTGAYVLGGSVSVGIILGSAFLPVVPRLIVWGGFALAWIVSILLLSRRARGRLSSGVTPTHSLVERFGLFTIIVLGEVVLGVVDGLSVAKHDVKTISTGLIALVLGFGFWWMYFDVVGRRLPRSDGGALTQWLLSHLPVTLSIAAAGSAMVSLIGHARERHCAYPLWRSDWERPRGDVSDYPLGVLWSERDRLPAVVDGPQFENVGAGSGFIH
jgi:low temperature requirement protein LtrA